MPAIDLNAGAELAGDSASLDVRLNAGSTPLLTATGSVPYRAGGSYDLKIGGKLDAGVVNPFFEARGMHVGGKLAVDATVGGDLAEPQIRGAITLAQGNFRDYVRGLNLTNINGEVDGSEGTLQIKSFKASAASGTIGMTGSIGVLQPGIPVDIKLTAANAQPIASNVLTANLNADIHISGKAREQLSIAGTIHVNRAVIGIPGLAAARSRGARRAPAREASAGGGQASGHRARCLDQGAARRCWCRAAGSMRSWEATCRSAAPPTRRR